MTDNAMDIIRRNFEAQFGSVDMSIRSSKSSKNKKSLKRTKQPGNGELLAQDMGSNSEASASEADEHGSAKKTGKRKKMKQRKSVSFMEDIGIPTMTKDMENEDMENDVNDDDDEKPMIVKFTGSSTTGSSHLFDMETAKKQKKLFMSSFAPKDESDSVNSSSSKKTKQPLAEDSRQELENDIALQRLIEESHILAEAAQKGHYTGADISSAQDISLTPTGKYRLKALDVRMQKLGVKKTTEKMPMNIRKGMLAKAENRQKKMQHEAKEAGIILAKSAPAKKDKSRVNKRDRGLKIEAVGRNTYHGLIISNQEIARVSNSGSGSRGKGKGKAKGKKRR